MQRVVGAAVGPLVNPWVDRGAAEMDPQVHGQRGRVPLRSQGAPLAIL